MSSNYKAEDIFNADEFIMLYQCLPDKTYQLPNDKLVGKKVRLTGMTAANALEEKLPIFAI